MPIVNNIAIFLNEFAVAKVIFSWPVQMIILLKIV